eukprot:CAMPEP_0198204252 /NCGR_PEP_ID=MMETSP1445-20131203/7647_1 /TAXON_ID=36898 /ORGANISM="Pyramimonas sp., Strain CCMP2087" /LENGTH=555 /DNA_ID=CAMNT_0043876041 /DNA_START=119 /DNA_END=1783 /DNA_ORIENTATION=+
MQFCLSSSAQTAIKSGLFRARAASSSSRTSIPAGARRRPVSTSASSAAAVSSGKKDYDTLCEKLQEISTLNGVSGLLGWDEQVMMPPGAAGVRSKQSSVLAGITFEKSSAPELGDILNRLNEDVQSKGEDFTATELAVIRDASRNYRKTTVLTKDIAQRSAELTSKGYQSWVKARQESDFSLFAPMLEDWVSLLKEKCALIDDSKPVYDVCLDDYERGLTAARLDEVFAQVKAGLVPLLDDIRTKGTAPDRSWLDGEFDVTAQANMCADIAKDMGFSTECGRLDVSVHPFTGGAHPSDVRMTTRFKANDLTEGLTGAVHETGHALYEQGRNLEYDGLPVNEALSMGIHESQSLLWERMVCLRPAFSEYLLPKMKASFPQLKQDATPQQLYRALNVVKTPSLIRVESDEVTYPMHIIMRYEMERALMEGKVGVKDLPDLWNVKMHDYLGCKPKTHAEGVLQDVHWSVGAIGYFPTYSLGAMYACQIYQAASKDLPSLEADIASGKFGELKGWLNERVHKVGSFYPSGDLLMEQVTGAPLDPSIFLAYLKDKYTPLY